MKKLLSIFVMIAFTLLLTADLELDIPYDTDLVGPSFAETGTYTFTPEPENFHVTNLGETDTFTVQVVPNDLPDGMMLTWCYDYNEAGGCLLYQNTWDFEFVSGTEAGFHPQIIVNADASFDFYFLFTAPSLSEPVQIDFTFTTEGVDSSDDYVAIPTNILSQNSPNPFNPSTTISYNLNEQDITNAKLEIINIKGQIVKSFDITEKQSTIIWNGDNETENPVASGIYFYKFSGVQDSPLKKMILLK
jgi:hypothetical protein